jgi:hypothetical protein
MGAGLTAAGTMVGAAGPITLCQHPAPPAFYLRYILAGAGPLVSNADDAEPLKEVFGHVTVQQMAPFGAHVALEPPQRAGDIRVLTQRDEAGRPPPTRALPTYRPAAPSTRRRRPHDD